MKCPYCGHNEDRVLDTREQRDGEAIRKRLARVEEVAERSIRANLLVRTGADVGVIAEADVQSQLLGGLDLILFSPSGTCHYYIVGWGGAQTLCRPTVHDCMLYERLSALHVLTPAVCRSVSRKVAADGYAGEAAQQAALNAERERALLA